MGKKQPKIKLPAWLQSSSSRIAMIYAVIIAGVLVLMNTYPLLVTQDLVFQTKKASLQNKAAMVTNALAISDRLTADSVEQSMVLLDDLGVTRALVTDDMGLVLYDSAVEPATGRYALTEELVSALRGNDVFYSEYEDGVFRSGAAAPIMIRGQIIGAVYLYESDADPGMLLEEIQTNLRLISVVVCIVVALLAAFLSHGLSRRTDTLLRGIQVVREGEYTHRIRMSGKDEFAQLADEFNQLTLRLQTTEAARRRFVSDASHELKTPLASIRLLTDSILQGENMDEATIREFVSDIGLEADRLIRTSEELLDLSRLDEGRVTKTEPVDVAFVAERVCHLLDRLARASEVTVKTDLEEGCVIRANSDEISQIMYNLTENAIKYNVPGGKVLVTVKRDGEQVSLTVADTGIGIPEEDLPRIFDRFYRVDKARSREAGGTGLGLSIVRDEVRKFGGTITVKPREEQGALFSVTFPSWKEEGAVL